MKNIVKHTSVFFKGFVMGIAEIVPGVSGSTLALVMKIYFQFISLLFEVSNLFKEILLLFIFKSNFQKISKVFKKIDLTFAFFLFGGMVLAILLFSNIMSYLLEERKEFVLAFFFGLVFASVFVPWAEIKKKTIKEILIVLFTFVLFFFLLSLKPYVLTETPHPIYFFFSGAVAICAMVLPGVSGSFIFLMLGVYEFIVNYIRNLTRLEIINSEILNLIFVFFGIVFGFSIFVRILKHGLKNHSPIIFSILTGIILASLRVLWVDFTQTLLLPLTSAVGFGVVFFLRKLS
jgi:putative membrane protein